MEKNQKGKEITVLISLSIAPDFHEGTGENRKFWLLTIESRCNSTQYTEQEGNLEHERVGTALKHFLILLLG
jgi:hypothetical protein